MQKSWIGDDSNGSKHDPAGVAVPAVPEAQYYFTIDIID
jgi:hypothetical protein